MLRNNPTLTIALALTILVELTLMTLLYQEVGDARLGVQALRLLAQGVVLGMMYNRRARFLTILIVFYHFFVFAQQFYSPHTNYGIVRGLMAFHLIAGFLIYQRSWLDTVVFKVKKK
ncbi:MAG TPA: hypothetical protein DCR93_36630 [Cytophagales bacterium]|nr:hypothetical protein [Cytophagales bacterium]HAP64783.1 hypothetical protein [Cytophagales bacterium]